MARVKTVNSVAAYVPTDQRIEATHRTSVEKDRNDEMPTPDPPLVTPDIEEKFEWREVRRGEARLPYSDAAA